MKSLPLSTKEERGKKKRILFCIIVGNLLKFNMIVSKSPSLIQN
jgi:hypothetical protein